jgi:hypothetical protein
MQQTSNPILFKQSGVWNVLRNSSAELVHGDHILIYYDPATHKTQGEYAVIFPGVDHAQLLTLEEVTFYLLQSNSVSCSPITKFVPSGIDAVH